MATILTPAEREQYKTLTSAERLATYVNLREDTGCLEWSLGRTGGGYGITRHEGAQVYAHRLAWELAHGAVPADKRVAHSCNNPSCVRLSHLYLLDYYKTPRRHARTTTRTAAPTVAAAAAAAATVPAPAPVAAPVAAPINNDRRRRLTDDQVRAIRAAYANGNVTQAALAAQYNVTQYNICAIVRNLTHKHLN